MYEMVITVTKAELQGKVQANRDKHRTVFEAALDGYRDQALQVLEDHIETLREGRTPELRIMLSRPQDHTRDYDRVLGMLAMHQEDDFELDEATYRKYVDDDWGWKGEWMRTSSAYAAQSVTSNYGVFDD